MAWNAAGTQLATASWDGATHSARVFDLGTGEELWRFEHGNWVKSVAFNAAGSQLATACYDRFARVYDLGTGQRIHAFCHGVCCLSVLCCAVTHGAWNGAVTSVAWNATGTQLATGSWDNFAQVFDLGTDQELQTLEHGNAVNSVAWDAA